VSGDYEQVRSRYLDVGGIRTHYLDAGDGPPVVLLHSGEFGGSAELCWEFNIEVSVDARAQWWPGMMAASARERLRAVRPRPER